MLMQDNFLNKLISAQAPVFCFLVNGIKLEGSIIAYDQFSIILASNRDEANAQLIMKSAVSTIVPKSDVSITPLSY
ncbi:MAG: RNA chaperone Hfq [Proteobacteria bacterium]|nr:MAG: RNA chaperone Hfq [Pseudomonadota bacterium]